MLKGEAVTLSYTAGANPIQDSAGNDAPSIADKAIVVDAGRRRSRMRGMTCLWTRGRR